MINKIVLGGFFGDEGKGQTVHNLCEEHRRTIVVRFSGANQVGHNVRSGYTEHCFRNFGSGTLKNVPTYWHKTCVCDPYLASQEYKEICTKGIVPLIYYHPLCEIVIPEDVAVQRNDANNRHNGTCGTGYKTCLDRVKNGWHLTVADALNKIVLEEKVLNIMEHYYKVPAPIKRDFLDRWLNDVHKFLTEEAKISLPHITELYDVRIFEGSQGILLDQTHGIMPFCTPSNTTSRNVFDEFSLKPDETETYYIFRPYITRHGNGPMLTDSEPIRVNDPNNQPNAYQGRMRGKKLDFELMKHSITIDGIYNRGILPKNIVFSQAETLSEEEIENIKKQWGQYNIIGYEYEDKKFEF